MLAIEGVAKDEDKAILVGNRHIWRYWCECLGTFLARC
jgi:hypothetical protein